MAPWRMTKRTQTAYHEPRTIDETDVKIVPILLAGGAGTRLWPVSGEALPKQFLPLVGDRSTYQETLLRVVDDKLLRRRSSLPVRISGSLRGGRPRSLGLTPRW